MLKEEFIKSVLNSENIQNRMLVDIYDYMEDLLKNIEVFKIQELVDSDTYTKMFSLINTLKFAFDKLFQMPDTKEEPLKENKEININTVSHLMKIISGLLVVNEKEFNNEIRYIKE
jgi:hypothetical protein